MGLHASFELRTRANIPKKGKIPEVLAIELKHAYLATASYVDAQVGKVINFLKEEGIYENTIIILWSDHGYHLGEMGIWGKATNYEIATRVPMILRVPNHPLESKGKKTKALVELLDIFPTICELSGVVLPSHLEGKSFVPLISNPDLEWKEAAFTVYPTPALREWAANPLSTKMRETYFGPLIEKVEENIKNQIGTSWDRNLFENHLMGYAMRTKDYRLVVWRDSNDKSKQPIYLELYDHRIDPKETTNIAYQNTKLTNTLLAKMKRLSSKKEI